MHVKGLGQCLAQSKHCMLAIIIIVIGCYFYDGLLVNMFLCVFQIKPLLLLSVNSRIFYDGKVRWFKNKKPKLIPFVSTYLWESWLSLILYNPNKISNTLEEEWCKHDVVISTLELKYMSSSLFLLDDFRGQKCSLKATTEVQLPYFSTNREAELPRCICTSSPDSLWVDFYPPSKCGE